MASEKMSRKEMWLAALKFVPLIIFALLVIVFQMDLLLAAPMATFSAIVVYMIVNRTSFDAAFEEGLHSVRKIVIVCFILMFAYGVAECFMATGVGASLIKLALALGVTARTVAVVALGVTCLLSIATGTAWGTFAACAPIFLWLNHLVGGDITLTLCSVAGGACFGNNIGMISDVTVLSCEMQNVKILDRIRHQGVWSLVCLLIAVVAIYFAGSSLPDTQGDVVAAISQIPEEAREALAAERPSALTLLNQVAEGVPYYMIVPLLVVIGLSFMGLNTLICLAAGMVSSLAFGLIAGTTDIHTWFNELLLKGFGDAGSWTVVMMLWVAALGGIMNSMNAFEPLARLVVRISRNVNQLMGWCGILALLGNAALADETAEIATMSPILRNITDNHVECADEQADYTLRLRLATHTASMGIYGSQLIPWHCFPVFFADIACAVYPLDTFTPFDIIGQNYLSFIVVGSLLLLSFTGWDRFIPQFGLPHKTRVKLKKQQS